MEKLLFSKLILITCIIFYSQSYSQDSYCVFKSEGTPIANNKTALKKGNILKQNDIVKLKVNESILMVDEKGALYKLENKQSTLKEYPYVEFSNYKIDQDVSSFSKKYLSYVWKRFSKGDDTGEHTGVVFRNNLLTLIQEPSDSVEIYRPEINFSWIPKNSKETQNYFLLKEKGKDHINKIGVNGNSILLFADKVTLVPGKDYLWTVSTSKYPDLDSTKFYSFKLLNKENFNEAIKKYSSFISDLESIGLSKTEIKQILCSEYNLCY